MARVLQVLGPSTGGIRRHVDVLARNLPSHGWEAIVAGPAGVMNGLATGAVAVPVGLNPIRAIRAARTLRSLARRADVIHAHGLTAGWIAVAARTARPVVVTVHNVVLPEAAGRATPLLRRLEASLPDRVDQVIAVSSQIADHLGPRPTPVKVIVPASQEPVPVGDRESIRSELGLAEGAPLVVTVARLHPQKAVGDLLSAMTSVSRAVAGVRLAVVGEGPDRERLEAEARRLDLDGSVDFVGARADAPDWMAAADVVVVSSIWEGSPLVVAEALQLGRPLVATDVGDISDAVVDGRTGRLVRPASPSELADAIIDLLDDPRQAAALGSEGQRLAIQRYGTDALVGAVAQVYDHVARSTSAKPPASSTDVGREAL